MRRKAQEKSAAAAKAAAAPKKPTLADAIAKQDSVIKDLEIAIRKSEASANLSAVRAKVAMDKEDEETAQRHVKQKVSHLNAAKRNQRILSGMIKIRGESEVRKHMGDMAQAIKATADAIEGSEVSTDELSDTMAKMDDLLAENDELMGSLAVQDPNAGDEEEEIAAQMQRMREERDLAIAKAPAAPTNAINPSGGVKQRLHN